MNVMAVFGRDAHRAFNVARQIDAGDGHVNGATVADVLPVFSSGLNESFLAS
jgi:acyl-CoA reductase-like NAD-dependent aldehyde dehydrogenase